MALTVADVVALPVVQNGEPEVLSDSHWGDEIRWVHVGDVADLSALLQGGELVLTTGAALRRTPRVYLQGLADAGALGVVVELAVATRRLGRRGGHRRGLDLALVALHREISSSR